MRGVTESRLREICREFEREGCVLVPGVLGADEVAGLRALTDLYYADRDSIPARHVSFAGDTFVLRHCADLDPLFRAMIEREPIPSFAAAVLGPRPAFNAMNVIRNDPGQAISTWHVDDTIEIPLPDDVPRFDPRIRMPVFWFTIQIALSDIDAPAHGPTQFVPGSHYSGRRPPTQNDPQFEGRGARDVLCRAGDIYFTNHQAWHRGAPNLSDRTRYVMQVQFAQRWTAPRFSGNG
ncbi:MAG TPA: phytanoyl-CoA dioxygenase family protein [Chthonomonadaceae bacterium]|nr:phytanoyl-CoA dioxygenase family protein [Chthonomonadaceae bacterium]